jgi:hypothetical protein
MKPDDDGIQEAFNQALAELHGYRNVKKMLGDVPEDKRLPSNASRQDQINHAHALKIGFKSVQDMINAHGMIGRPNSIEV